MTNCYLAESKLEPKVNTAVNRDVSNYRYRIFGDAPSVMGRRTTGLDLIR